MSAPKTTDTTSGPPTVRVGAGAEGSPQPSAPSLATWTAGEPDPLPLAPFIVIIVAISLGFVCVATVAVLEVIR